MDKLQAQMIVYNNNLFIPIYIYFITTYSEIKVKLTCYLNALYDFRCESSKTVGNSASYVSVCLCVYLWRSLLENILSLNDVSHHSVFQLLVLLSSQLDGL